MYDWLLYVAGFVLAFFLAKSSVAFWREELFKHNMDWVLLEVRIPRETTRGPKAMEQVFASVFNLRNDPVGPKETYVDGEITRWFSFEIVASQGSTRIYLRLLRNLRHPFTSSLYAQYPELEIVEVDRDYIDDYPATYQELKKSGYELYGLELMQDHEKGPAFGFTTYVDFEPKIGDDKGRIIDSMSGVLEVMGRLKSEETVWIQFLCIPDTKYHWLHDANHQIDKMKSATQGGDHEEHGATGPSIRLRFRTQGEEQTLKRIEAKKGKASFEVIPRIVYIAPESIYNRDLPNRGIYGYIAQFGNDDQKVEKDIRIRTRVDGDAFPYVFPNRRLFLKRVKIYEEYRRRFIPEETFVGKIYNSMPPLHWCFFHRPMILSSEELATFFHIPTNVVMTSITMDRIESKRLSPPSNLPR